MKTLNHAKTLSCVEIDESSITDVAVDNLAIRRGVGWKVSMGWNSKNPYGDIPEKNFHFMDHLFMLKCNGVTLYCAEPYGLEPEDITELARLIANGWDVSISQLPLWYPGRTTQVVIQSGE